MIMNPLKKQNKFYFDIERVLFTIHMMVASTKRSFLKLKYFYELFMANNNSREVGAHGGLGARGAQAGAGQAG
jgi:hypothetical protein